MEILQMCSYYHTSKIYKNLFTKFDKNKIKQKIFISILNEDQNKKNLVENLKYSEFIYSKNFNQIDRFIYFSKIYKIKKDLLKKIDLKNIDLIHAHSLFINGGVAYNLYKNKGIDYIVAVRSTDVKVFFKYFLHLRKLGVKILKNAKKIVFISPSYKKIVLNSYIPNRLRSVIEQKTIVIPNGIDKFWLQNKRESPKELKKNINLVYAGKFNKNKNIRTTIKVARKLKNRGHEINLNVVGRKKSNTRLERLFRNNGDLITIYGFMDKEKLIDKYNESDIFIMPSYKETFGLVYIEALSQGLPLIYTKNEGIDGYFENGEVGYPNSPKDINEISENIELVLSNYKAISKRALKRVDDFSWEIISKRYIEIYKKLIGV